MGFPLLAASAVVPSLLIMWYFRSRDVYPEPAKVIWTTFFFGVLICAPVIAVALPMGSLANQFTNSSAHGFAQAFLSAAIPEEAFKFIVVYFYCARHEEFDEPMDGIVYGVVASLGFATLENILYVSDGGLSVAALRAFTAVPGHALTGAVMGYFVGQARFAQTGSAGLYAKAFIYPTILHGLYDFPLLAVSHANKVGGDAPALLLLIVPVVLLIELIFTLSKVRLLRSEQLGEADTKPSLPAGAPAAAPAPAQPGRFVGWFLLLIGIAAATLGGLVVLGILLAFATGSVSREEVLPVTIGSALIGLVPLIVGTLLFRSGVGRLNRTEFKPISADVR